MVRAATIPQSQDPRHEAVNLRKHHPDWSLRKIGSKIGKTHRFVSTWVNRYEHFGTVTGKPRAGRRPKASTAVLQHVVNTAALTECRTSAQIAAKVQLQSAVNLSARTVRRVLRNEGLRHLPPRIVPMLTRAQKAHRVKFAKAALRLSWKGVMVTDSSYFKFKSDSRRSAARWCRPSDGPIRPTPKHSPAVHVYMGISYHGMTSLRVVSGTHKQHSKYTNSKTGQPMKGVRWSMQMC